MLVLDSDTLGRGGGGGNLATGINLFHNGLVPGKDSAINNNKSNQPSAPGLPVTAEYLIFRIQLTPIHRDNDEYSRPRGDHVRSNKTGSIYIASQEKILVAQANKKVVPLPRRHQPPLF